MTHDDLGCANTLMFGSITSVAVASTLTTGIIRKHSFSTKTKIGSETLSHQLAPFRQCTKIRNAIARDYTIFEPMIRLNW